MRYILFLLLLPFLSSAQNATEIYLFDLQEIDGKISLSNPVNISNQNPGYDNQPSFMEDGSLLYVATRNGQTDVVRVNPATGERSWLTETPGGGEYSPTAIPGGNGFSAIRLDTTGFQRLYAYDIASGNSEVLVDDLKIGYHAWLDESHVTTFVLGENSTLQLCNIKTDNCRILGENIGRSLHRIPGSEMFSYIDKSVDPWEVRMMNPATGESTLIIETRAESEDVTWAPGAILFSGQGSKLYAFKPETDQDWVLITDLSEYNLSGITRLAISPQGNKMAIVVAE